GACGTTFMLQHLIRVVGRNTPGAVRVALNADARAPQRLQPADMSLDVSAGGLVVLRPMVLKRVLPPVRLSDGGDRDVRLAQLRRHRLDANHAADGRGLR